MDEMSPSGISEGELETDLHETVLTGCQNYIRSLEETALALYSTTLARRDFPSGDELWYVS